MSSATGEDRGATAKGNRSTSRTTPKDPDHTVRPQWHKFAGWAGVAAGVLPAVLNDAMFFTDTLLLPFGHSELYLLLGVVVAAWSTRFLGLFDRHTIYV